MNLAYFIFLLGVLGFVLNRTNIIIILISIEIILLSVTLIFIFSSIFFDDIKGILFTLFIITIAGAESALGLGLLVAYYRTHGTIKV